MRLRDAVIILGLILAFVGGVKLMQTMSSKGIVGDSVGILGVCIGVVPCFERDRGTCAACGCTWNPILESCGGRFPDCDPNWTPTQCAACGCTYVTTTTATTTTTTTTTTPPTNCQFIVDDNTSWNCSWNCNTSGEDTTKWFKVYGGPGILNFTDHNLSYTGFSYNATNCCLNLTPPIFWNLTPS